MSENKNKTLYPTLSVNNADERDKNIQFQEEGHKYTILTDPDSKYTSVTTWNHSHFPHFNAGMTIDLMMKGKNWKEGHKYWGLTKEEIIKKWSDNGSSVSGFGTDLHFNIECFMNNPPENKKKDYIHKDLLYDTNEEIKNKELECEWEYFLQYVKDYPEFKPYRTEWLIYHEDLKLSGSIDMVYENDDGTINIYDWKRSKDITKINKFNKFANTYCISHMPDSNFWHYALQLNTYKKILEEKYGKKVKELCLVRLHPDAEEKTYELIPIPDLSEDILNLFALRKEEIKKINKI